MPQPPASTLAGRRGLVTGGASGIGSAVATRLAEVGVHVTLLDRDDEAAAEVAARVGGRHVAIDLADGAAVDALDVDADIVVNSAGMQHVAPWRSSSPTGSPSSTG
jgi:3-hydroxybutyrate dehydrogenase